MGEVIRVEFFHLHLHPVFIVETERVYVYTLQYECLLAPICQSLVTCSNRLDNIKGIVFAKYRVAASINESRFMCI